MKARLTPTLLRQAAVSLLLLANATLALPAQTLQWTAPLPVPAGYDATLDQSSLDGLGGSAWVLQLENENLNQLTRIVWLGRRGEILYTNDVPAVMGSSNQVGFIRISPTELALTLTTFQNDVFPNVVRQSLRRVKRQGKTVVVRDAALGSGEFVVGEAAHTDRLGFFSVGQTNGTQLVIRRYSNTYPPLR